MSLHFHSSQGCIDKISLLIDGFCREELLEMCEEEDGIAIDRKGFERWMKMSKEVLIYALMINNFNFTVFFSLLIICFVCIFADLLRRGSHMLSKQKR